MTSTPIENLPPSAGSPHVVLSGNERANYPRPSIMLYPFRTTFPLHRSIHASWQSYWDQCVKEVNNHPLVQGLLVPNGVAARKFLCPFSVSVILVVHTVI